MKTAGKKKSVNKSRKKKSKVEEWSMNIIALVLFGGGMILFVFMNMHVGSHSDEHNNSYFASLPSQGDTIAHSKICMVDDIYQADYPTVPVELVNKTYYGCDIEAIQSLTTKPKLRSAIDPINQREIDKASAVIAIHPKRDGKVLYFESMKTFKQYLNALQEQ